MYSHFFIVATQFSTPEPILFSIRATYTADFFLLEFFTDIALVGSINHKAPDSASSLVHPNTFLSSLF
jgi:hypothetical protein